MPRELRTADGLFSEGAYFVRRTYCYRATYCSGGVGTLSGDGGVDVGGDRLGGAGQGYQHDGAGLGGAFDADGAAVVVDDFADDGEAETGAVGFAGADEGVEHVIADGGWDAGALVDHANLEGVATALHLDKDAVMTVGSSFAGVQEQIEKHALEF